MPNIWGFDGDKVHAEEALVDLEDGTYGDVHGEVFLDYGVVQGEFLDFRCQSARLALDQVRKG